MDTVSTKETRTLALDLPRIVLRKRRAQPFFFRHPWVYSGAIGRVEGEPAIGAEVAVLSDRGDFIARGLFNPVSKIQVRLYSWDAEAPLDEAFWDERITSAVQLRHALGLMDPEGGCRLIFSEGDGLSGLVVDRYRDWLLVQFTSHALASRRDLLLSLLQRHIQPAGIWLRTEKGMREAEGLEIHDGPLTTATPPRPMIVHEHGLSYAVDVVEGQKTGFFLDQRENRQAIAPFVPGRRVLDMFCYTGGFALNAARFGASEVLAIDGSDTALALARDNAVRNGVADRIRFEKADGFKRLEALRTAGEKFGMVILDPPKMARSGGAVPEALKGYHWLNALALQILEPNGILVTCSCTGHVTREEFEAMLAEAALTANRRVQILSVRGAAPDHPVSLHCLETAYLKCYVCRVE